MSRFRRTATIAWLGCVTALTISAIAESPPTAFWERTGATVARSEPAPRVAMRQPTVVMSPGTPAETKTYSLADLESLALSNNPTLRQASAAIDAARGKWVQDGLYPNPKLMYRAEEIGNQGTAGFQGAAISQEIVTAQKRQLSQYSSAHLIQQAEQEFAAQEFRVRNDVRMRFYDTLLAQQAVELNEKLREIATGGSKAANDLFKAQEVSRIDVLQSKVELDTVAIQAEKARNAYAAAWRRLAAVVGRNELPPAVLTGDVRIGVMDYEWEGSVTKLLAGSPELAAARSRVQAACWALQRANAERHPNLNVEVGALHDNVNKYDVVSVNVGIPVPLFNRNQGNIQAAYADVQAAQAEVDRITLDLRQRLAAVYERYGNAQAQVDRYERDILPAAKESWELVGKGYRAGESNVLMMLTAQRTYVQAQMAHLESLRELRQSAVLLDGMLLQDSLAGK